jgi:hypothetical protein
VKTISRPGLPGMSFGLLFLCSCAVADSTRPPLPAEVSINTAAGRGGFLIVTLRAESGEGLPFIVDTGSPITFFDKSLEPKLGRRLGTMPVTTASGDKQKSGLYAAPKIYLGGTPLVTGGNIVTRDFRQSSRVDSHVMGILGMDCFRHYCLQLDFDAGKMRFLYPDCVNASELGNAFSLTFHGSYPFIQHTGLVGESTNLMIDVGCRIDGLVNKGKFNGLTELLPECVCERKTYSNLIVAAVDHVNSIGLNFLSRHLVTLDFPKKTMYLKQTSIGPLDISMRASRLGAPMEVLEGLKEKGQLVGLSKDAKGVVCIEENSDAHPKSATLDFRQNGDSSVYRYIVSQASEDSPWRLEKAWQTDAMGKVIKEYPVP